MGSVICISLGRGRHKHLIAEYLHVANQGAKLVELRLDYIQSEVNLKRILADRPCPVLVTCRRERDGGMWKGTEEQRQMLLRTAIVEGVDYVDLEEDIAASIPRFGKTKRIVSYHNFNETPENIEELHAKMGVMNADIVKLATLANNPRDNVRMLRLVRTSSIPTVGLCMGEIGTPSRILGAKFGAPFSYATFHVDRTLAPGQLSYAAMKEVYRYEEINSETEFYGVIADPVAHSMSPQIHNAAFAHLGMNRVYIPLRVTREHLARFLNDCEELGIKGLSVTIPHKESVMEHLSSSDDAVQGIHACNTVVFREGQRVGFNTDSRAALESIDLALGNGADEENRLLNQTVLVLGAGGVAKAIVYGLRRQGADVYITNRTPERAQQLAAMFRATALPWNMRHTIQPQLIVNCTSVGMHPQVNDTPLESVNLDSNTVVFDTVYNPEQTLLLKQARETGCRVITGVDMFIGQAALQFKHFTGESAPLEVMKTVLRRAISAVKA
jgi:3-dehydroquinate dehydratase / shikimate dehydrogenase